MILFRTLLNHRPMTMEFCDLCRGASPTFLPLHVSNRPALIGGRKRMAREAAGRRTGSLLSSRRDRPSGVRIRARRDLRTHAGQGSRLEHGPSLDAGPSAPRTAARRRRRPAATISRGATTASYSPSPMFLSGYFLKVVACPSSRRPASGPRRRGKKRVSPRRWRRR